MFLMDSNNRKNTFTIGESVTNPLTIVVSVENRIDNKSGENGGQKVEQSDERDNISLIPLSRLIYDPGAPGSND